MESRDSIAFIRAAYAEHALQDKENETLIAAYGELSTEEAQRVAAWALDELPPEAPGWSPGAPIVQDDEGEEGLDRDKILLMLACLVPNALEPVHRTLAERGIFHPSILYRGADADTRDFLLELHARQEPASTESSLVDALSWIGGERVAGYFRQHGMDAVQREAGWELLPDGTTQRLWVDGCHALVRTEPDLSTTNADPVNVGVQHEERCEWCGKTLSTLFDLRLSTGQLDFLGLAGERLRIATCDPCTGYGTIFTDIDFAGLSTWSSHNVRPEYIGGGDYDRLPERQVTLGRARRTPVECYWEVYDWEGASQLGGHPTWLQPRAAYPECPSCHHSMRFIGQLATSLLEEFGEGITYAYLCTLCNIAATNYQQT